jgi:hypothetical protein
LGRIFKDKINHYKDKASRTQNIAIFKATINESCSGLDRFDMLIDTEKFKQEGCYEQNKMVRSINSDRNAAPKSVDRAT